MRGNKSCEWHRNETKSGLNQFSLIQHAIEWVLLFKFKDQLILLAKNYDRRCATPQRSEFVINFHLTELTRLIFQLLYYFHPFSVKSSIQSMSCELWLGTTTRSLQLGNIINFCMADLTDEMMADLKCIFIHLPRHSTNYSASQLSMLRPTHPTYYTHVVAFETHQQIPSRIRNCPSQVSLSAAAAVSPAMDTWKC